ncbi:MAG: bifunctional riboflavin kinase/FAD synthetase [Clostridia bacterium]|nr:bifunctional riboflavin kinase/FAD synthetase [Clostridia bacterium]
MSNESFLKFVSLGGGKEADMSSLPPLVLAIGNFDGVHLGHKRLIKGAVSFAEQLNSNGKKAASGVFCFSVPPADLLMKSPPPHITTLDAKLKIFASLGAEYAVICDFASVKDMEAEDFIGILKDKCSCISIVCGFNFRFGKNGLGTPDMLKKSEFFGENAFVFDAVSDDKGAISSSRIRKAVSDGDIELSNRLLGHPFSISGKVIHGKALGRSLGLPTVNQSFDENSLIPQKGIYVSSVIIDGERFSAVTNIGKRPTFEDGDTVNCETHIIDFEGDLYEKDISVRLHKKIRDEKKFSSPEELVRAIEQDIKTAKNYFS